MFLAFTDFSTLTPAIVISSIGGHGQCLTCITKNFFSRLSYSFFTYHPSVDPPILQKLAQAQIVEALPIVAP